MRVAMLRHGMRTLLTLAVLAAASPARADDPLERAAMARVRLTTEGAAAQGCPPVGRASDDSVKDLRRKVVRAGGDTAVITFGTVDDDKIYATIYRCAGARRDIPPPPPGQPPPPPPQTPAGSPSPAPHPAGSPPPPPPPPSR